MASESLVTRLETAVAKIEALVPKLGRKAGGGGADDDEEVPEYVSEWETFVANCINPVAAAADASGIAGAKEGIEKAFGQLTAIVKSTVKAKVPSQAEWGPALQNIGAVITDFGDRAFRRPKKGCPDLKDHYTGLKEFVTSINFVTMAPPTLPVPYVASQGGTVMFSLNKVLRKAKENKDEALKTFVTSTQKATKELGAFVKKYWKTGLDWNAQGKSISEVLTGAATNTAPDTDNKEEEEPAKKPAPKPKESKTKKKAGGGMAALFGELNKKGKAMDTGDKCGEATSAFGLKKVDRSQMTHKNKGLRKTGPVPAGAKRKVTKPKPSAKKVIVREPSATLKGDRWFVEHYRDGAIYKLPEDKVDTRHTVFISRIEGACVQVPGKVKSVMIDGCKKARIFVNEVISVVEMVNCKSTTVFVQGKAPSVAVDKSESARIFLTRTAFEANPDIITSNISAMNIEVPGATDDDDPIEIAVPEQYISKINLETKKLTTHEVKHG